MLLSGDAYAADAAEIDAARQSLQHGVECRGPVPRMLLGMADRKSGDQRVGGAGLGDHLAGIEVEHDRLGALGAGIDADEEGHFGPPS